MIHPQMDLAKILHKFLAQYLIIHTWIRVITTLVFSPSKHASSIRFRATGTSCFSIQKRLSEWCFLILIFQALSFYSKMAVLSLNFQKLNKIF